MGSNPLAIMLTGWLGCAEMVFTREKEMVVGYLASTCKQVKISFVAGQGQIFFHSISSISIFS
jgi:hypothetical protein